jgi:death-on-curing protein
MDEPTWMQRAWVEAIHADQIRQHGGSTGIRDEGLIESALACPRNLFAYEGKDLARLAAAYAYGLARNHGFIDGNKRIAFQTMFVFLGLNGWRLVAEEPEVVRVVVDVAAGTTGEADLAAWVRDHIEPR